MEILDLIHELVKVDNAMWVVGGGEVVSENNTRGIKEPDVSGGYVTIEADNWHFHLGINSVTGVQFVEAESHGDLRSYYVRFSNAKEETLVRCYFPNPYLDDNNKRTELQPEKMRLFEEFRDRYVGHEGIIFVRRPRQPVS